MEVNSGTAYDMSYQFGPIPTRHRLRPNAARITTIFELGIKNNFLPLALRHRPREVEFSTMYAICLPVQANSKKWEQSARKSCVCY
jgi:hypothetical protein